MRQQYAVRSLIIVAGLAFLAVAVVVQMIRIQTSEQALIFLTQGDRYGGEFQTVYPERGEIYDRNGHLLAGNWTVYEVGVSLRDMESPEALSTLLSKSLGLTYEEVYKKLTESPESWEYVVVQDYVPVDTVKSLQDLIEQLNDADDSRLDGLSFKPHLQRSYPEKALASNVLGFVTRDGRGYFGIEEKYNDLLAGTPDLRGGRIECTGLTAESGAEVDHRNRPRRLLEALHRHRLEDIHRARRSGKALIAPLPPPHWCAPRPRSTATPLPSAGCRASSPAPRRCRRPAPGNP